MMTPVRSPVGRFSGRVQRWFTFVPFRLTGNPCRPRVLAFLQKPLVNRQPDLHTPQIGMFRPGFFPARLAASFAALGWK